MTIFTQLINFAILFGLLFLIARKMVFSMFKNRREKISADLDAAQQGHEDLAATAKTVEELQAEAEQQKEQLRQTAQETIARQQAKEEARLVEEAANTENDKERETKILRHTMIHELDEGLASSLMYHTRKKVTIPAGFDKASAAKIAECLQKTAGDAVVLRGKRLPIKLEAASPVEEDTAAELIAQTAECYGFEAEECDVSVSVNKKLAGGLRLTVNSTVYDGTVLTFLADLERSLDLTEYPENDAQLNDMITQKLQSMDYSIRVYQTGKITSISDGICHVSGLTDVMYGERIDFENGIFGMALDLETDYVGCIVFGEFQQLEQGDPAWRSGKVMDVPVGENLLGRVVDALGKPIDGLGMLMPDAYRPIECEAPGIPNRKSVSVPLQTGIKAVDALIPLGRGQRELIVGDRQTGKTAIAVDTIINQKDKNVICIYVAIGQKESTVASILNTLKKHGAMDYTTIVCADAFHSSPMQYVAPYAGAAMGEYFMYQGKDVLIVYDDLSKHAVAYREISLLLHRPSGREAYPGDVFYLHSRLLERSARLDERSGGGSITALPIIETQAGDISAYIPTNVISITDGQIFLESELFHSGQRPAVNVGLSVSRVGGSAQIGAMRQISGRLRMDLAQYRELSTFSQFGSDLDASTKRVLDRGARMMSLLNQPQYSPMSVELQVLGIFAVSEGYADSVPVEDIPRFEKALDAYFTGMYPEMLQEIASGRKMSAEFMDKLRAAIEEYKGSAA